MTVYRATRHDLTQVLIRGDLEDASTLDLYRCHLPERVHAVYSDPPWNPGIATWFRSHAGFPPLISFDAFNSALASVLAVCTERGATAMLVEQSADTAHQQSFLNAASARGLPPIQRTYRVRYSGGVNDLLHLSGQPLTTDPSDLGGITMTTTALLGLGLPKGAWLVDPCLGKGLTSRAAHRLGLNLLGGELAAHRLDATIKWLIARGYIVETLEAS